MQKYFNNVTNLQGRAVANATVSVTTLAGAVATLYSDDGVTLLANPLTTDERGYFEFYAANGHYNISASGRGIDSFTIDDVILFDYADGVPPSDGSVTDAALSSTNSVLDAIVAKLRFLAAGVGAVYRPVRDKLRERISPEDFGAEADNVADDSAAFQLAIDRIASNGVGTLWLTPGKTYYLNSQINLCDNLVVWGYGAKIRIGRGFAGINNPLFKNFSGTAFNAPGTRLASRNIAFYGITFDGEDTGVAGSTVADANMHGAIICVGGWTADSGVDGLVVRDCDFSNFAGAGVMAWKSTNITIDTCRFKNFFANAGLSIGSGIDLHECGKVFFSNLRITHDAAGRSWHGMVILDWDAGSSDVTGNVIYIEGMNGGDGISCEGNGIDNLARGNFNNVIIRNCAGQGLGFDRCVSVTASNVTIEDVTGPAILFTETQFTKFSNIRIANVGLGGIVGRSGVVRCTVDNVEVTNVTYSDANYRGHAVEVVDTSWSDSTQIVVSGSTIKDCDGAGIYAPAYNVTISGNNIYNAGRSASNAPTIRAAVVAAAYSHVFGNTFVSTGNTHYAVSSGGSDFPSIEGNRIRGTFATAYYYIPYRGGNNIYHNISVSIEDAKYDASTNVFTGRFAGTPAGYWYLGDTFYNTAPAAAGSIGSVVVSTPSTWKTFGAISA